MSNQLVTRPGGLLAPHMDYLLVDSSSSMTDKWSALIAGLQGFIDGLKTANLHSHGIIHRFDTPQSVGTIVADGPIADWQPVWRILGNRLGHATALYDAINFTGRDLARLNPPRASLVIVTDGDDMRSVHTDVEQARAILDWCRAQGWQVTFFGCDFDNSTQARALGADAQNALGVRKEKLAEAAKLLADKRVRYANGADDIGFNEDERKKFGGYLGFDGSK